MEEMKQNYLHFVNDMDGTLKVSWDVLELISKFNIQNSVASVYTNNKLLEKELKT